MSTQTPQRSEAALTIQEMAQQSGLSEHILRYTQGHGYILQMSSIGGIGAFPILGLYHASKRDMEGFSEALSQEVTSFGIHVTLIEPGGFTTDWSGSSSVHAQQTPTYAPHA